MEQNSNSAQNSCMLKVVDIGIYSPVIEYGELIGTLEKVAENYMKNKLTAPSAKELYFKSIARAMAFFFFALP